MAMRKRGKSKDAGRSKSKAARKKLRKSRKSKKRTTKKERIAKDLDEFISEVRKKRKRLNNERTAALEVLNKHRSRLMRRAGVVGVDVGFRMKKDQYVIPPKYVIRVDVEYKYTKQELRSRRRKLLPRQIDGIDVKVLERRYVPAATNRLPPGCNDVEWKCRRDPIVGGIAIARDDQEFRSKWGTLGVVVYKHNNEVYLTNAHLVSEQGEFEEDAAVRQPPMGPNVALHDHIIGHLMDPPVLNAFVDCAIITPAGRQPKQHILGLKKRASYRSRRLTVDDEGVTKVLKVGAKTGFVPLLVGLVDNTEKTVFVEGLGKFFGQIVVRGEAALFQEGGDSGAVIVVELRQEGKIVYEVVGLCFAATDDGRSAIACHFSDVADELGVSVNLE